MLAATFGSRKCLETCTMSGLRLFAENGATVSQSGTCIHFIAFFTSLPEHQLTSADWLKCDFVLSHLTHCRSSRGALVFCGDPEPRLGFWFVLPLIIPSRWRDAFPAGAMLSVIICPLSHQFIAFRLPGAAAPKCVCLWREACFPQITGICDRLKHLLYFSNAAFKSPWVSWLTCR